MDHSARKKYKTGIFIGKFFPMHLGHISGIRTLEYFCEKVFVLFYNNESQEKKIMNEWGKPYTVDLRMADAQKVFKNSTSTIVAKLSIPDGITFPTHHLDIKTMVEAIVGSTIDVQTFGAEEKAAYEPYKYAKTSILGSIYAVENVKGEIVPLHATLIRNEYDFYKKHLPLTTRQTIDSL